MNNRGLVWNLIAIMTRQIENAETTLRIEFDRAVHRGEGDEIKYVRDLQILMAAKTELMALLLDMNLRYEYEHR